MFRLRGPSDIPSGPRFHFRVSRISRSPSYLGVNPSMRKECLVSLAGEIRGCLIIMLATVIYLFTVLLKKCSPTYIVPKCCQHYKSGDFYIFLTSARLIEIFKNYCCYVIVECGRIIDVLNKFVCLGHKYIIFFLERTDMTTHRNLSSQLAGPKSR